MHNDIHQSIAKARAVLSGCRCDYAEIRLSSGRGTTISLSGNETDAISSGDTVSGSIRVLSGGAIGFISFNDLSDIERSFKRCLELSASARPAEKIKLRAYKALKENFSTEKEKDPDKISFEEKFNLISSYNTILGSSRLIQTTRAVYRELRSYSAYLNSEGSEVTYDKSYCGVSLSSVAKDGSIIQPHHESYSGYGGFELAENRQEAATRVAKTAVDLLSAEPAPGGTYRVMADQELAGVFIHEAFGHLSEADFIHQNERLQKMMQIGRRIGPEPLNVYDCGDLAGLAGYIPCDDEGVLPGRTCLIGNGLLRGRLHSRETSEKMGEAPTGNARAVSVMNQPIVRMTNTFIENGIHDKQAIMEAAGDGIYAAGAIGGETNLEMFTFTSKCGYEIRKGKIGKMYRDIVLSGNVFTTLADIEMIGNDRRMFGGLGGCGKGGQSPLPVSFGAPHLLIKDVLIGGPR
jgi:TldD protein